MDTRRAAATLRLLLAGAALIAATACASSPSHPGDPIEGLNRAMYAVDTTVVDGVLDPVAKGYRAVVPEPGRDAVHNVLGNLRRPTGFVNHVLQADPIEALTTAAAFAIDTTIGLAGIWRPAESWGVVDEQVGFADTLTNWGFGRGPYVVLPLFGAGVTRGVVGRAVDAIVDPTRLVLGDTARLARAGTSIVDVRERTLDRRERIKESEEDPYAATRARVLARGDGRPRPDHVDEQVPSQ